MKLSGGRTLEMKSWTRWFPEKIQGQFMRDALILTDKFTNLDGFQLLRWVFEGPPGTTEQTPDGPRFNRMTEAGAKAEIQKAMEAGLVDAMNTQPELTGEQRKDILAKFREQANRIIVVDDLRDSK